MKIAVFGLGNFGKHLGWDIHEGIAAAWKIVSHANAFVDSTNPFSLAKDPAHAARLDSELYHLAEALTHVSVLLNPIMPTSMAAARTQIGWTMPEGFLVGDLKMGPAGQRPSPRHTDAAFPASGDRGGEMTGPESDQTINKKGAEDTSAPSF